MQGRTQSGRRYSSYPPQRAGSAVALVCALTSLGLHVPGAADNADDVQFRPHPAEVACVACHAGGADDTSANANWLTNPQETLCASACHSASDSSSHPSGMLTSRALPNGVPADRAGRLTCSTCHDVHKPGRRKLREALSGDNSCTHCHDAEFFSAMPDLGASLNRRAHLLPAAPVGTAILDPLSLQCIDCHDDEFSVTAAGSNVALRHSFGRSNHPIGSSYAKAARFGGYRPVELLNEVLLLPDGKLACVSCHAPYAREHGRLVTSSRNSGLCAECHEL